MNKKRETRPLKLMSCELFSIAGFPVIHLKFNKRLPEEKSYVMDCIGYVNIMPHSITGFTFSRSKVTKSKTCIRMYLMNNYSFDYQPLEFLATKQQYEYLVKSLREIRIHQ